MRKIFLFLIIVSICSCHNRMKEEKFQDLDKLKKENLVDELRKMVKQDQFYRNISFDLKKNSPFYKQTLDSVWEIIDSIDLANTMRLIEITEKYGFPNVDRIGAPIPVWLIFQHAPKRYKKELKVLLKNENKAERLPDMEYTMIKWHLNGRKDPIPFNGVITQETIDSVENI